MFMIMPNKIFKTENSFIKEKFIHLELEILLCCYLKIVLFFSLKRVISPLSIKTSNISKEEHI